MKKSPHGKIARLPHHIREQIHSRLRQGERAKPILAWLNSLPEVQQILAASFGSRPIDDGNLSEWKQRSHRLWLIEQTALTEVSRFLSDSRSSAQAGQGAVTDSLATFLSAQYAVAARMLGDDASEVEHWKLLRALCHDVVGLRRGDHNAQRLRLQQQRLALRQPTPPATP